jgi:hypothetical protein
MIGSAPARWLLSAVFALAMAGAALAWHRSRTAERDAATFCVTMCAALVGMVWGPEPTFWLRAQALVFGCAAAWFARFGLSGLRHVVMAGAMIWMLLAAPEPMGAMPMSGPSTAVFTVSALAAVCCAITAIPWLARAITVRNPAAASHAIMSAGMTALLLAML